MTGGCLSGHRWSNTVSVSVIKNWSSKSPLCTPGLGVVHAKTCSWMQSLIFYFLILFFKLRFLHPISVGIPGVTGYCVKITYSYAIQRFLCLKLSHLRKRTYNSTAWNVKNSKFCHWLPRTGNFMHGRPEQHQFVSYVIILSQF